jgi:HEAT repeat protein
LAVLLILIGFEVSTLRYSLSQRLISSDDAVRNQALSEISRLGPEKRERLIADLLKQQENAKPRPKRFALYALRVAGGKSPAVITAAVRALSDNDPHVRTEAQLSLLEMGEPALPDVASAAKSDNEVMRGGALLVLEKAGAPSVPFLISLLSEPSQRVPPVIEALARLGEVAKPAVPGLVALFASPDPNVRLDAALAANTIQRPTPEALPIFAQALKARAWDVKSVEIVRGLEDMGSLAKPLAADLTKIMMQSPENFSDPLAARTVLAQALSELDPRRSELVDLSFDLRQKAPALRYRAAHALSVMDPPNVGALEMLVGALDDADVTVVARALIALKRIGLDKTERLGKAAAAKIAAAQARVKAAGIMGFDAAYGAALPTTK